jgi:hypothetical protein
MQTHTLPSRALLALIGAAGAALPLQAQAPSYEATYLGPFLGPRRMAADGLIVGTSTVDGNQRAYRATAAEGVALLPLPTGYASSWANDVNQAGVIAGAVGKFYTPDFSPQAVLWTPDGAGGYAIQLLPALPGHIGANAVALNGVGDVVGYSTDGTFRRPVLFTAPGGLLDLTFTGIFDPQSINDQRVLVDRSFVAKRMDLDTLVAESLGLPAGPPSYMATAGADINAFGQVAGYAVLATSTSCAYAAALYTDGPGWDVLSGCGPLNGARDVNDLGDVVMQLNAASYVRFAGLGTFEIESLIQPAIGHWYVQNTYGLAINNARQIALVALNTTTGENGLVLLSPSPTCQEDLGLAGPGEAVLSLCGGNLAAGTTADLELAHAAPFAPAFFAAGPAFAPTALLGGTAVTFPPSVVVALTTDALGRAGIPGIPGGGGPATLYAQAAFYDAALPQGFGFSNALRVELLP